MYLYSTVILMLVIWSCQPDTTPPTTASPPTFQARIQAKDGEPVAFASVILLHRGSFTLEARTTSDAKGRFSVEVAPGKAPWWLLARDAHETYLDTSFLFTPQSSTHVLSPAPRPPPLESSRMEAPDGPSEKKAVGGDLRGDINGTGEVNHWDLMLLLYHLVGSPAPRTPPLESSRMEAIDGPSEKKAVGGDMRGDINGTGEVNHWDLMLLYHLVGWPALDSSYDFELADINSDSIID